MKESKLTSFEWQVLKATLSIPMGETRSYQWVARKIGKPQAVRAVGQALKKNPYPLVIPCHRVIKSNGNPGGYMGIKDSRRKSRLLGLEQKILQALKRV